MDTAWIQVFVLTLAECVAPAGKTVCQEQEFELVFLTRDDCQAALEEFVALKEDMPNVIVDRRRSTCAPSAREGSTWGSLEAANEANRDTIGWQSPAQGEAEPTMARVAHEERLEKLETCEASGGVAPCKIGEIIIEGASGEPVEVWRRDD